MAAIEFVEISPSEVFENRMHFIANPQIAILDQTKIELFGAEIVSVTDTLVTIKLKNTDTHKFNEKHFYFLNHAMEAMIWFGLISVLIKSVLFMVFLDAKLVFKFTPLAPQDIFLGVLFS
jgi:hypothetical protein